MTAALIRVRVAARQDEALDICSLDLVPVDGSALPAFSANTLRGGDLAGGWFGSGRSLSQAGCMGWRGFSGRRCRKF